MPTGADSFVQSLYSVIVQPAIFLLGAAALLVFVWGLVEFLAGASEPEKRSQGQRHIIWGLVGLVIIISTFTIIEVINTTVGGDIPVEIDPNP